MSSVQIKIAGLDATSVVLFSTAYFMSSVNGVSGEAKIRVRDLTGSASYKPGDTLELLIDGDPVWTGWVQQATRVYVFPALDVADFGPARFFDLTGSDLNVLLTKRIVFNQTTPENILSPLYGPHTADTTALTDLFADWLDLTGDGIDTSSGVHNVGDINEDQDARPWSGSDTWGQAVQSIAMLPAAIWYIRPNKVFAYVDTDTPDAPFGLSDVPNHTTTKGYREMEILLDGTSLANDVMCWGLGYGSSTPVFKRDIDATSVTDHGVWQLGQVTYGVYKQATIDRIADSILNGSPDHHRGFKDDRPAVTLTTYEAGLLPAQKVNFESQVFGWSDVIPIRKMEVTFESPENPKYVLTLSHEIDTPWSFFDPWRLKLPHLPPLPPFKFQLPGPHIPGGCSGCGHTDDFDRTGSSGWGVMTNGLYEWFGTSSHYSVTPGDAVYAIASGESGPNLVNSLRSSDAGNVYPIDILTKQAITDFAGALNSTQYYHWEGGSSSSSNDVFFAQLGLDGSAFVTTQHYLDLHGIPEHNFTFDPLAGTFWTRLHLTSSTLDFKVWLDGDPEPSSSISVAAIDSGGFGATWGTFPEPLQQLFNNGLAATWNFHLYEFQWDNIDRCTVYRYDNFGRTEVAGWGTGTAGQVYTYTADSGTSAAVNPGAAILVTHPAGGGPTVQLDTAGALPTTATWDFLFSFTVDVTPAGPDTTLVYEFFNSVSHDRVQPEISVSLDPLYGFLTLTTAQTGKTDWVIGQSYSVRFRYQADGNEMMRIWDTGTPEPGTWDVQDADAPVGFTMDHFYTWLTDNRTTGGAQVVTYAFLDFAYDGRPCYSSGPPPTPPVPGGPLTGPFCEDAVRIDSTHYQLSRAVAPGSTTVMVGTPGFLYLPGIARDYTVNDDTGVITFTDAISDPSTRVNVCYTANGLVTP